MQEFIRKYSPILPAIGGGLQIGVLVYFFYLQQLSLCPLNGANSIYYKTRGNEIIAFPTPSRFINTSAGRDCRGCINCQSILLWHNENLSLQLLYQNKLVWWMLLSHAGTKTSTGQKRFTWGNVKSHMATISPRAKKQDILFICTCSTSSLKVT